MGYTLSKTERRFDDIDNGVWFNVSRIGRMIFPWWEFTKQGPDGHFRDFVYSTGNAVTFPAGKYRSITNVFLLSGRNSDRMPDYHRLDLAATLEAKAGKKLQSSWSMGFYNVYGRKKGIHHSFRMILMIRQKHRP